MWMLLLLPPRKSFGCNSKKRVKLTRHFVEIDRLADSFNTMVDQLHFLIGQMREMTDNIAHDLRSPLTRIRGNAEMALISNSSPIDFKEMAINTVEECDNLIQMINTMLDITEAESELRSCTSKLWICGCTLVEDACALFSSLACEKGIRLQARVLSRTKIITDKGKLQRIMANLLENAIKYTPVGFLNGWNWIVQ